MNCRACHATDGNIVLDLADQPACDHFPLQSEPGPDPVYSLEMWLCARCGLAQLREDPTAPEEPRGTEPRALVEQAADAVARVAASGWLTTGITVAEFGSPHGGSWLPLLIQRGLSVADVGRSVDLIVDCFGLMHEPEQASAIAERADLLSEGGTMLLQYHSLETILRLGQWNSLRHGHYAYYSTAALSSLLAQVGFEPRAAWRFDLYGGTVLLAATRTGQRVAPPNDMLREVLAVEKEQRLDEPASFSSLQRAASAAASALHDWLLRQHSAGRTVLGYGAASRAVPLLCAAGVTSSLLPAIADVSQVKQGRRIPGTDIPVVAPMAMLERQPDTVVVLLPDLLDEVRSAYPALEAHGGQWVSVDHLTG